LDVTWETVQQVEPWMPNGYGNQTLYEMVAFYTEEGSSQPDQVVLDRVAFRTVRLVQDLVDPSNPGSI